MMTEAKHRSAEIIAQGEKLKTETVEQAKVEAKAEADRIIAAAKAEIQQEVARAKESLRDQVARPRRRRRVEDPAARSRRQGARRPHRRDPAAALTGRAMAELTTIARPYAEAAFALARERQRAAGLVRRCCGSRPRSSPTPQVAAALDNPKLDRRRQGVAAAVDLRRQARRRAAQLRARADRGRPRSALLPQIRAQFETLKDEAEGVAKARIEQRVSADRRASSRS